MFSVSTGQRCGIPMWGTQQSFRLHTQQQMQYVQPTILPNAAFAEFSEGHVHYGLDPSKPMIPVHMIPTPIVVPQPTNLLPVVPPPVYNQNQPAAPLLQPWFVQPPQFSQTGVPLLHPIMQTSADANFYGPIEQIYPEVQLADEKESEESSELERLFDEYVEDFKQISLNWPKEDAPKLQQLLCSIRSAFDAFKKEDEEIYRAANNWNLLVQAKFNSRKRFLPVDLTTAITNAYIDCLNEVLNIMDQVGQEITDQPVEQFNLSPKLLGDEGEDSFAWKWWNLKKEEYEELPKRLKMIVRFEEFVKSLRRHDFDSQDGLKFDDLGASVENLKYLFESFKEAQIFKVLIKNLQTHVEILQRLDLETNDLSNLKMMHDFICKLQSHYDNWGERINLRLRQSWTQAAWQMDQLIDSELKRAEEKLNGIKKKQKRRKRRGKKSKKQKVAEDASKCEQEPSFQRLIKLCSDCLDFLQTDSFDCKGRTLFPGYDCRHLHIFCMLFKFMYILGIPPAASTPDGVDNRGKQVVLYRCKREISFGQEAYSFGEFVQHIMKTKAVDMQRCYCVVDHKPKAGAEKQGNKSRRVQGVLFYWILASEAEAEKLLQLFVAWCEPKFRRNQIIGLYPELLELQRDSLTPEQDAMRSHRRQTMVRKECSMKLRKSASQQQRDAHALEDEDIRRNLCEKKRWSDEDLVNQKKMYHFTFTSKRSQVESSKSKGMNPSLSDLPSSKDIEFPAIVGC